MTDRLDVEAEQQQGRNSTAIASEGVALKGTPIINNALAKTPNIYISICADLSLFVYMVLIRFRKIFKIFIFYCFQLLHQ